MSERASGANNRTVKISKAQIDFTIFFVVLILVLFGIIMIFSSSYYYTLTNSRFDNDMYYFLKRQLIWAALGITVMVVMMNINYHIFKAIAFFAYIFSNICLVLVLFIGQEINGAKRWLGVTDTIGFQPSEVAKISLILFLAFYISSKKDALKGFGSFVKCMLIVAVPVVLIAIENLSTAVIVFAIGCFIIFIASPKIWYFIVAAIGAGAAAVAAVSLPQFAYRFERIQVWKDPFLYPLSGGWQTIQSLYALASGGLFGLGLGQSRQKTFIPESYNDIIFAIICEELGLFGAIIIILLFAILIWRGLKSAMNTIDVFGCLVATGITGMIAIQVILNIAVVTNTIPNTGVVLPFVSYGGTSFVLTMASMGILLNISRFQRSKER
ncbi:MAG: FtsW/RodA/SpoVE family cell cycle protein [Lachnospiraceae bacterium]|nr:FtsW/RodA/SpoVE family cell cycle protein [Lachnospiraceae bacterium]